MLKWVEKVENNICTAMNCLMAVILGAMILINVAQVVCRYLLPSVSLWWSEDISILGILWITALGAPVAWLKKSNLIMDVISGFASEKILKILDVVIDVVGMLSGIGLIVVGRTAYLNNKGFVQSGLKFDESFRYIPVIVFGAGLFIAALLTLIQAYFNRKNQEVKR